MKKLLLLTFLFQSLLMSAKVYFSEYPDCFIGSEVKIKYNYYEEYQKQYQFFFRSFENGKLSKGFPKDKGIEPYLDIVYTITAITDNVQYKNYTAKVLTLENGSTKLYYFVFFESLQDRFTFLNEIECQQYIEDSIRAIQTKVEKRIVKKEDPFLGTTTYRLIVSLLGIDFPSMECGYISTSKSYKGTDFVCYIVNISLISFRRDATNKGLHIIWANGEHYVLEDLPIEMELGEYSQIGRDYLYNYTAQLVLTQEEYEVFCNNKIANIRLGSGIDEADAFKKNGDLYKYCFNAIKSK